MIKFLRNTLSQIGGLINGRLDEDERRYQEDVLSGRPGFWYDDVYFPVTHTIDSRDIVYKHFGLGAPQDIQRREIPIYRRRRLDEIIK